jgi:hypothetical protein
LLALSAPGPDTVNVQGTTAGTTTAILAGSGGGHTFNVGSTTDSTSTLDAVQGLLNINSKNATDSADTLHIFDKGSTTPHIYTITPGTPDPTTTTFQRSAPNPVTIQFSSIITLAPPQENPAGPGSQAAELAFPTTIEAGRFATMSGRLVGTGELSLSVDWGDGTPVAHSTPDLRPFSIKHKYERPGTYHVRAVWTDSSGQSGFRELTITVEPASDGGDGEHRDSSNHHADAATRLDPFFRLSGNGDQDILNGGRTASDRDRGALEAIMAGWGGTDLSFHERVDRLLEGEGVPALHASTVFAGDASNVLEGGQGRDLFFASFDDVLLHRKRNDVVVHLSDD